MFSKSIKLSKDKTADIIDNEVRDYAITITKDSGYSVQTDKQELKKLCKKANESLADSITVTNYRMLDGIRSKKIMTLTDNEVNKLFDCIGWSDDNVEIEDKSIDESGRFEVDIETPQSFNNLLDEKTYFIKTMNYGEAMLTDDDIENNKHVKFFKTKENREFDVMEAYNSVM